MPARVCGLHVCALSQWWLSACAPVVMPFVSVGCFFFFSGGKRVAKTNRDSDRPAKRLSTPAGSSDVTTDRTNGSVDKCGSDHDVDARHDDSGSSGGGRGVVEHSGSRPHGASLPDGCDPDMGSGRRGADDGVASPTSPVVAVNRKEVLGTSIWGGRAAAPSRGHVLDHYDADHFDAQFESVMPSL